MQLVAKCSLTAACLFLLATIASAQGLTIPIHEPRDALKAYSPGVKANAWARLLNSPVLANELKLTNEQKDDLKKTRGVLRDKQRELFPPVKQGAPRKIPTPKQQAEANEKFEKYNAELKKQVESVLNEQQKKRLGEIQLQLLGIVAFASKDVRNDLKVSRDQIEKIESIMDSCASEIEKTQQGLLAGTNKIDREMAQKMRDLQTKSMKDHLVKIEAVLTDDQKKAWAGKLGEELDMAKLQKEEDEARKPKKK